MRKRNVVTQWRAAPLLLLLVWSAGAIEADHKTGTSTSRRLRQSLFKQGMQGLTQSNGDNPQGTVDDYSGPEARIIGGSAVDPFQDRYPYFALMWGRGLCGGVLISPSIVLSAAHCELAADAVTVGVQSREQSWITQYDSTMVIQKVVHPNYDHNGYAYDVMVMKLATPSNNTYVRLNADVGLPSNGQQPMWVMGFGDTEAAADVQQIPNELRLADVYYVPPSTCDALYRNILVSDDMLCATNSGKDACGGDSGGPLVIQGTSPETDVLMGLVSWGIGCAQQEYPGVYSRTSYFYNWIVEQVCLLSPQNAPEYMACLTPSPVAAPSVAPLPTAPPSVFSVPSAAPSVAPAPSAMPSQDEDDITFVRWTVGQGETPLSHCQADCDSDDDCEGELVCFFRSTGETVPGCRSIPGALTGAKGWISDICVYPWDL